MSLLKRDGVNSCYYLIHIPDTEPKVLTEADLCNQDILDGTARENHSDYPMVVHNQNETPFLPSQLLECYLSRRISMIDLPVTSGGSFTAYFDCDEMFTDHAITVYGSLKKGVKDAYIEG